MCHLLVKTHTLLEWGQKAACKKELSCYVASKILIRERFWTREHNPGNVIQCTVTDHCVRCHHPALSTPQSKHSALLSIFTQCNLDLKGTLILL